MIKAFQKRNAKNVMLRIGAFASQKPESLYLHYSHDIYMTLSFQMSKFFKKFFCC